MQITLHNKSDTNTWSVWIPPQSRISGSTIWHMIRLENGDTLIQFYHKKHTKFIVDDPTYNDIIDKYYTIKKQKVIFR